jgi:hypothetical protein
MNTRTIALTIALGILLAGSNAALSKPIDGSQYAGASTTIIPYAPVTDSSSQSWTAVPGPLSVSASATSHDDAGNSGNAYAFGNATWALDGDSGTIQFQYGWSGYGEQFLTSYGNSDRIIGGIPDWSYTFTADANGSFVMDYDILGSGALFGLSGYTLSDDFDSNAGGPVTNQYDPSSSGIFEGGLTAGQTYTVSLSNNGNIQFVSYDIPVNGLQLPGSVTADFDWSIQGASSVADGGTTIAMLGGAIFALAALRRRFAK